jgi:hypothetical protein
MERPRSQRLQIPESLRQCLATTNTIEGPQGGVERRTQQRDAMAEPPRATFRIVVAKSPCQQQI